MNNKEVIISENTSRPSTSRNREKNKMQDTNVKKTPELIKKNSSKYSFRSKNENQKEKQIVAVKDVISDLKKKEERVKCVNGILIRKNIFSNELDRSVDMSKNDSKKLLNNTNLCNVSNTKENNQNRIKKEDQK